METLNCYAGVDKEVQSFKGRQAQSLFKGFSEFKA
jgi:hypothetical protein